jgi:wyosine [tRNA(Phe)-imidazoG37] synthetase (radical SAM superfamily)
MTNYQLFLEKPLVLYGAGNASYSTLEFITKCGITPVCFVDRNIDKIGTYHCGYPVISLDDAVTQYKDFNICISTTLAVTQNIYPYLLSQGISESSIYDSSLRKLVRKKSCLSLETNLVIEDIKLTFCCDNGISNISQSVERKPNIKASLDEFFEVRHNLIAKNTIGEQTACTNCTYLFEGYFPANIGNAVSIISYGGGYKCNCRCIYCDRPRAIPIERQKRFEDEFDLAEMLSYLSDIGAISNNLEIGFASTEITLDPRLDDILNIAKHYNCLFMTTGIIYNDKIAIIACKQGSEINVSLDAGTSQTYKAIKQVDAFDRVCSTLQKYCEKGANISLKYIRLKDNLSDSDLEGFFEFAKRVNAKNVTLSGNSLDDNDNPLAEFTEFDVKFVSSAVKNGIPYGFAVFTDAHKQQVLDRVKQLRETD